MQNPYISVVSPIYGCKTCLYELYFQLKNTLEKINSNFEIILVNDASPDGAWETIVEIAQKDIRVKGVNLSRNFGQHFAITAGLEQCKGDWVVVIDCDLQDRPEEIAKLLTKANEGFDIVLAQRFNRHDNFIKKLLSKAFYKTLSYLTESKQDHTVANFGIYNKKVIHAILTMKDHIRYFPTMVMWVGFRQAKINVKHSERFSGKTSYSAKKLLKLALDIILSFSDKPLRLTIKLGLNISFLAILFALYNLYKYLNGQIVITGWTSLILSIWFLSGIIIFVLGIIGLYVGKTFEKVKNRPTFIIKDMINE